MEDLADAVQCAARGEATLNPRVAARAIQEVQGSRTDPTTPFDQLTDRELEILKLIANGLSNSEIVATLVVGENTVKGHVSNILSKLHLADRTPAAVMAWRGVMRQ
ncbi:MAG: response regulator transcription factor [Anaerolineales bacterium]|nr:response regulator transcription factor [Anaerolineales bacterium]